VALALHPPLHKSLGPFQPLRAVLDCWRFEGSAAAQLLLQQLLPEGPAQGLIGKELRLRLAGVPGPRVLLDGIWFSRPHGGITRVWEQILRCWQLPGLITPQAHLAIIDRNSHLSITGSFENLTGAEVDPLDYSAVAGLSFENSQLARSWGASVFLSSWISTSAGVDLEPSDFQLPELVLVHDCLPERGSQDAVLLRQRRRWLKGARSCLAVSAATAVDLEGLLQMPTGSVPWCHSGPDRIFHATYADSNSEKLWPPLQERAGLTSPYVLLPATYRPGSYKNPELVAAALQSPGLEHLQLALSGLAAETHCATLLDQFPHLQGRCFAAGFTDLELALAYRHALAVVLPSRIEGFGLPAIEALASGATVLVADARGLREAGAGACPRVSTSDPADLAAWLRLLLNNPSRAWLLPHLQRRAQQRLQQLHPDLLGLALLALARQCCGRATN